MRFTIREKPLRLEIVRPAIVEEPCGVLFHILGLLRNAVGFYGTSWEERTAWVGSLRAIMLDLS